MVHTGGITHRFILLSSGFLFKLLKRQNGVIAIYKSVGKIFLKIAYLNQMFGRDITIEV
jgi:hypothetical protein